MDAPARTRLQALVLTTSLWLAGTDICRADDCFADPTSLAPPSDKCVKQVAADIKASKTLDPATKAGALIRLGSTMTDIDRFTHVDDGRPANTAYSTLIEQGLAYLPAVKDAVPLYPINPEQYYGDLTLNRFNRWSLRMAAIAAYYKVGSPKAVSLFNEALADVPQATPDCAAELLAETEIDLMWLGQMSEDITDDAVRAQFLIDQMNEFSDALAIPAVSQAVVDYGPGKSGSDAVLARYSQFISEQELSAVVFDGRGADWITNIKAVADAFASNGTMPQAYVDAVKAFFAARDTIGYCPDFKDSPEQVLELEDRRVLAEQLGLDNGASAAKMLKGKAKPSALALAAGNDADTPFNRALAAAIDAPRKPGSVTFNAGLQQAYAVAARPGDLALLNAYAMEDTYADGVGDEVRAQQAAFTTQILENDALWRSNPSLRAESINEVATRFNDAFGSDRNGLIPSLTRSKSDFVRVFASLKMLDNLARRAAVPD